MKRWVLLLIPILTFSLAISGYFSVHPHLRAHWIQWDHIPILLWHMLCPVPDLPFLPEESHHWLSSSNTIYKFYIFNFLLCLFLFISISSIAFLQVWGFASDLFSAPRRVDNRYCRNNLTVLFGLAIHLCPWLLPRFHRQSWLPFSPLLWHLWHVCWGTAITSFFQLWYTAYEIYF